MFPSRHGSTEEGSGRRVRTFVAWFKARKPTASRSPIIFLRAPCGSRTHLASLEGWSLCRSAKGARKAEGEGVEPWAPRKRGQLIARPASNGLPSPIGLTFQSASCGGWNRTSVWAVNSRLPVPTRVPPQAKSGWPDLNRRSRAPETRGIPGFPTSCLRARCKSLRWPAFSRCPAYRRARDSEERPAGVEPALPPWQGDRLPPTSVGARMGAFWCAELSMNKSTERESNPRHRITKAVSSPLDYRCHQSHQWDQRDLNPHLAD